MTLDDLATGSEATVASVGGEGVFRRRLLELGLLPGTRVARIGQAPLGDPLRIRVRDVVLSIRRVDARRVELNG